MSEDKNKLQILICTDNDLILSQCHARIVKIFEKIPYEIKIEKDGIRAMHSLQKHFFHLFVCDSKPIGIDPKFLLQFFQEKQGGSSAIVFSLDEDDQFDNVDLLPWPIADWDKFDDALTGAAPEEMKIKYGLHKKIPPNLHSLLAIASEFNHDVPPLPSSKILMISDFFYNNNTDTTQAFALATSEIKLEDHFNKKFVYLLELFFLLLLVSLDIYFLKNPDYETDSWVSLRGFLTINTSLCVLVIISSWNLRTLAVRSK